MRHLTRQMPIPSAFGFDPENEDDEDDESGASGSGEEEDEEDEDEEDEEDEDDNAGLLSALRKERKARKRAEKENRELEELRKFKRETEEANAEKAEEKATKLETALREERLVARLTAEANKQNFIDPEDAILGVDEDLLEFDDDGNVDKDSVKKAVKDLAERKKHLIDSGDSGASKSGSKFGGGKGKKGSDSKALQEKYPALRR